MSKRGKDMRTRAKAASSAWNILLVDHDRKAIEAVCEALGKNSRFVLTISTTAEDAVLQVEHEAFDLVLIDLRLVTLSLVGQGCIAEMRARGYGGPVCVVAEQYSIGELFSAAEAGADDFLMKSQLHNLSFEVERLVESGRRHGATPGSLGYDGFLRSRGLGPDQIRFLELFLADRFPRLKDFSQRLGLSETNITKRLSRIREKLDLDNMAQLAHVLTTLSFFHTRKRGP